MKSLSNYINEKLVVNKNYNVNTSFESYLSEIVNDLCNDEEEFKKKLNEFILDESEYHSTKMLNINDGQKIKNFVLKNIEDEFIRAFKCSKTVITDQIRDFQANNDIWDKIINENFSYVLYRNTERDSTDEQYLFDIIGNELANNCDEVDDRTLHYNKNGTKYELHALLFNFDDKIFFINFYNDISYSTSLYIFIK